MQHYHLLPTRELRRRPRRCAKIAIELEDGTDAVAAANRVIEIAGQVPAPSKAAVREQAKEILRFAREHSDAERDAFSLRIAGQETSRPVPRPRSKENQSPEGKLSMIEIVDPNDARAVRNKNNILACYELLINQKKAEEGAEYVIPDYIQHNPLLADGRKGLAEFFAKIAAERAAARVVVHKIIAVGDWVWAHGNFLNMFTDDPYDTGIAVVDMWIMNAEGECIEHWDVLQVVGDQSNAAPWLAPNLLPVNTNGMF